MPIQNTLFDTNEFVDEDKLQLKELQQIEAKSKHKAPLTPLEKEVKKFEKLLNDIDLVERETKNNEDEEEAERQQYMTECVPEFKKLAIVKYEFLIKIERIYEQNNFSKNIEKDICGFIMEFAEDLTAYYEPLLLLQQKYYNISLTLLSDKEKKKVDKFKQDLEEGNTNDDNEEPFNGASFFEEAFGDFNDWQQQSGSKKKVANIDDPKFVTSKELYKDLAKALHPDLEQDEKIKLEKVKLMQELSIAKQNNDLYAMLQIQKKAIAFIKVEQQQKYLTLEKLKKFNALLQQKLKEKKHLLQVSILNNYTLDDYGFISKKDGAKKVIKQIKKSLKGIKNNIGLINTKYDLIDFLEMEMYENY